MVPSRREVLEMLVPWPPTQQTEYPHLTHETPEIRSVLYSIDSVRPHRRQPIRLPCPWDSPGKNTIVGCHFLLQCMKVKSEVAQSCPTLSDPTDGSPPGSSVHEIFQARVLEWGAIAFSGHSLPVSYLYFLRQKTNGFGGAMPL